MPLVHHNRAHLPIARMSTRKAIPTINSADNAGMLRECNNTTLCKILPGSPGVARRRTRASNGARSTRHGGMSRAECQSHGSAHFYEFVLKHGVRSLKKHLPLAACTVALSLQLALEEQIHGKQGESQQ